MAGTATQLKDLLEQIYEDLHKATEKGNKAAAQRVRTKSIKFEKIAKLYRKESVKASKVAKKKKAVIAKKKK